jgi:hypothetical protein
MSREHENGPEGGEFAEQQHQGASAMATKESFRQFGPSREWGLPAMWNGGDLQDESGSDTIDGSALQQ